MNIYDRDYWWGDNWDPLEYGKEYDFSKPFFEQFKKLLGTIPMPNLFNQRTINSEYTNHNGESKNSYLIFACWDNEDIMYSKGCVHNKESIDLIGSRDSELGYELINSNSIYRSQYLFDCDNCSNCAFLYDCNGCQDCFMSSNLRNKQYVFRGQQLSKENYKEKIKEINFGNYEIVHKIKQEFSNMRKNAIHKYANLINCTDCTGDNMRNSKNCRYCFDVDSTEDSKFHCNTGMGMKDCHDSYGAGAQAELMYEIVDTGAHANRLLFDVFCWGGDSVEYSYTCHGSENIFGCIGINKGQYCILNKQYTKEEYEELVPKIKQHMNDMPYVDAKGREYRYGEFFPTELSPFAYNETIAQEYYPLTKSEVEEKGFTWRDKEKNNMISL